MNVNGNSISIDIGASSEQAVNEINRVSGALKNLKTSSAQPIKPKIDTSETVSATSKIQQLREKIRSLNTLWSDLPKIAKASREGFNMNDVTRRLRDFNPFRYVAATAAQPIIEGLEYLDERLARSGHSWSDFIKNERMAGEESGRFSYFLDSLRLGFVQFGEVAGSIGGKLTRGFGTLASSLWNGAKAAFKFSANIATIPFKKAIDSVKNFVGKISQIGSAIKRIAFYRLIRSAIKAVTEALQEGVTNAYWFSKQFGNATKYISDAYDSLSSASFKLGNQMGAAWATLYAQIAPIIESIISLVTRAMQVISQFLAAMGGRGTYMRAIDYTKEWADETARGGGAAKEWRNQLMGFDEINRLEEPNKGGGGGGGKLTDYNNMFDEMPIEKSIRDFVSRFTRAIEKGNWQMAGNILARKINSIFPKEEQWQAWGETLGYGLNGAIQTMYYALDGIDFGGIGAKLAAFLNGAFSQIDFTKVGALLVEQTLVQIDFWMGFLGNLDWGQIGKSIGDLFRGALDKASEWLASKDWRSIGQNVFTKFKEAISGIDFAPLADSFFHFLGEAFTAAVLFIDGFFSDTVQAIKDYFKEKTEEMGGDTWEGFKKGITDAWKNVKDWCKEHIVDPFVNGVKDLLGIHSPSTVFADIGGNIIAGLQSGLSDMWSGVERWISDHFGWLISWCQSACSWLNSVLVGVGLVNGANLGSTWQTGGGSSGRGGKFASGGFPDEGQLFIAREAGPELVGTMGGRTAVANNDQIVSGIREGVFDAVLAAMSQSGGNGDRGEVVVKVYLDSREIKAGQDRLARAWG